MTSLRGEESSVRSTGTDKAGDVAENEVDRFLASLGKEMDSDRRNAEQRSTIRQHKNSLVQAVEKRRGSIPDDEVDAFLQNFFVAEEVAKAEIFLCVVEIV